MSRFQTPVAMSTGAGPREKMLCAATSGLLLAVDDVLIFGMLELVEGCPMLLGYAVQGKVHATALKTALALSRPPSWEVYRQKRISKGRVVSPMPLHLGVHRPGFRRLSFSAEHDRYRKTLRDSKLQKRSLCICKARSMLL